MTFDPNDPRLTAYALGELDGDDLAAFEGQLAGCAESRKFIDEIRETARLLTERLHQEPSPGLTAEQKDAIEAELTPAVVPITAAAAAPPGRSFRWAPYAGMAAAAGIMGATALLLLPAQKAARRDSGYFLALGRAGAPPAAPASAPAPSPRKDAGKARLGEVVSVDNYVASFGEAKAPEGVAARGALKREDSNAVEFQDVSRSNRGAGSASGPVTEQFRGGRMVADGMPAGPAGQPGMGGGMGGMGGGMGGMMGRMGMGGGGAAPANQPNQQGVPGGRYRNSSEALVPARPQVEADQRGLRAGTSLAAGLSKRRKRAGESELVRQSTAQDAGRPEHGGLARKPGQNALTDQLSAAPKFAKEVQTRSLSSAASAKDKATSYGLTLHAQSAPAAGANAPAAVLAPPAAPASALHEGQGRKQDQERGTVELAARTPAPADAPGEPKLSAASAPPPAPVQAPTGAALGAEARGEAAPEAQQQAPANDEAFDHHPDNPFVSVATEPRSTFSIDVDTASYANVRRFLNQNTMPPVDAVRIEELLNYFPYRDPAPTGEHPLAVHAEVGGCPWNADHRLMRVALSSKPIPQDGRPLCNLMFLIDVSGSMDQPNKLPLVQASLRRLVEELGENDRVGIVVYAGASGLVLPSTSCLEKSKILEAIDRLQAGGSTNGGAGIELAYQQAVGHFIKKGANRVILATDGDFNVGVTSRDALVSLIEAKRKSGVYLSVLGFGMGNLKDGQLEQLADKGNGHYAYIDSLAEAEKVLVKEMGASLVTVAKDVKFQVQFNPSKVGAYRLIGYENRVMAAEDFANDQKDAGEVGAGHHVTALYELVPPGPRAQAVAQADDEEFEFQTVTTRPRPETVVVKVRYKLPGEETSRPFKVGVVDRGLDFSRSSLDFKFASSVAGFGMLLRHSPYKGSLTYGGVLEIARSALADDPSGYRKEFVGLVEKAQTLAPPPAR